MARRSPTRWLAPVAIVVCAAAIYGVTQATLEDGGDATGSTTATTTTARAAGAGDGATTATTTPSGRPIPRTYTVRTGDVLSAIAARTGVSVDTIQQLNPDVDPRALRVGQKLKLRQ